MSQWWVPALSALVVVEWLAIVLIRRTSLVRTMRIDGSKLTFLDVLILLTAAVLLVASLQYIDIAYAEWARVAAGTLRVVLCLSGGYILWSEWHHRGRSEW